MVDLVEELFQVQIDRMAIACRDIPPALPQGLVGVPPRPETVAVPAEMPPRDGHPRYWLVVGDYKPPQWTFTTESIGMHGTTTKAPRHSSGHLTLIYNQLKLYSIKMASRSLSRHQQKYRPWGVHQIAVGLIPVVPSLPVR